MNNFPGWVEVIVAFTTLVTALGVLWSKIVQPLIAFVLKTIEVTDMLPWLRSLKRASENIVDKVDKPDKENKP